MSFCSLNSVEGLETLRTLSGNSEGSVAPASVVDVRSISSDSGILMDESVVGDSEDDIRSVFSGLPMDESVVDYFLEDYDYNNDTVLTEVTDHDFVDLLELYDQ